MVNAAEIIPVGAKYVLMAFLLVIGICVDNLIHDTIASVPPCDHKHKCPHQVIAITT